MPTTKGRPLTEEHKQKLRLAKLGVPKSEEHKHSMSLSCLGRKRTPESIAKQCATWAAKKLNKTVEEENNT